MSIQIFDTCILCGRTNEDVSEGLLRYGNGINPGLEIERCQTLYWKAGMKEIDTSKRLAMGLARPLRSFAHFWFTLLFWCKRNFVPLFRRPLWTPK